ncbi:MAG: ribonuclease HII [Caulobacteraceae bacterium]
MLLEKACIGLVCGVDEAGRGPWAGPVSAAAVILNPRKVPKGLNDSRSSRPGSARPWSRRSWTRRSPSPWATPRWGEIAELNILHATGLAMRRAVEALKVAPAIALVDGNYAFPLPCPVKTVVKGDGISCSIAAASILAKVARDRLMAELDALYPGYGFASHKGYHAEVHVEALRRLGPCPEHRMTWAPVRLALEGKNPMMAASAYDED